MLLFFEGDVKVVDRKRELFTGDIRFTTRKLDFVDGQRDVVVLGYLPDAGFPRKNSGTPPG